MAALLGLGNPSTCSMPCRRTRKPKITRAMLSRYGVHFAGMEASLFASTLGREDLLVFRGLRRRRDHLHQVRVRWHQSQGQLVAGYPRLRVCLRVVDRDGELEGILVHAVVAFLDAHLGAVRVAGIVEPGSLIRADRLHD